MSRLPREAREGLMRVWLEILHERNPEVTWVMALQEPSERLESTAANLTVSSASEQTVEGAAAIAA